MQQELSGLPSILHWLLSLSPQMTTTLSGGSGMVSIYVKSFRVSIDILGLEVMLNLFIIIAVAGNSISGLCSLEGHTVSSVLFHIVFTDDNGGVRVWGLRDIRDRAPETVRPRFQTCISPFPPGA